MINAFVGKPGTGKTYSLVCLAIKAIENGRDVYSNFFIDEKKVYSLILSKHKKHRPLGKIIFWRNLSDLISITKGEILMDEAQIYINAREFRTLPPEFQYKAQQHRKHGVNFWFGVQNIKRIDVVARELINSVFEFKKVGNIFIQREYDIEDIDKSKRSSFSFRLKFFNPKIASCYDTLQEIRQEKN